MRPFVMLAAATAALSVLSASHAAEFYDEPLGSPNFGSASPPVAGTQEYAFSFGSYYFDNPAHGRTIATGGPVIDLSGLGVRQIRPILRTNAGGGGDVDLFQVTVTDPNLFHTWTARTSATPNTFLLTLFASNGTAIAASLGGVQAAGPITFTPQASPLSPTDPGVIRGSTLGLTPGNYYIGVSNYIAASGKGQPKNNAGQNLFTPVAGTVVTPNALGDLLLSTDPLKAWDLYSSDVGTVGSFDATTGVGDGDRLLGTTSFTAGSASFINVFLVPEPATGFALGMAGLSMLARRRRS